MIRKLFCTIMAGYVLACLISCNNRESENNANDKISFKTIKISINPKDTSTTTAEKLFKSVEFIPLETRNDCLIGKVDKMAVTDKYFIVLDRSSNSICFFLKNGKYSHKITSRQQHKMRIGNFDVNKNLLYVFDYNDLSNRLTVFDFQGNEVSRENNPQYFIYFKKLGPYTLYYNGFDTVNRVQDDYARLSIYNEKKHLLKTHFKFNPEHISSKDLYDPIEAFYSSGNKIFLAMPGINEFFKIDSSLNVLSYALDFPSIYHLPKDFLEDVKFLNNRNAYLMKHNREVIWNTTNVYQTGERFLSFNLQSINNLYSNFIYDLKTKKAINLSNVFYDKKTSLLPITEHEIIGADNGYFYGCNSSKYIFDILLRGGYDVVEKNRVLSDFVKKSNAISNPVITKFSISQI